MTRTWANQLTLPGSPPAVVSFDNALELIDGLAASPDLASCATSKWLRYALGRMEAEGDDIARPLVSKSSCRAIFDTEAPPRPLTIT